MKKEAKQKLPKGIDEVFVDSLNTMQTPELKALVVQLQLQNQENEAFKESQSYLEAKAEFDYHKERFDQVAGPVRDTTTILKNKTKMVIEQLKQKGGA